MFKFLKNYHRLYNILIRHSARILWHLGWNETPKFPIEPPEFLDDEGELMRLYHGDSQKLSPRLQDEFLANFALYPHLTRQQQDLFWAHNLVRQHNDIYPNIATFAVKFINICANGQWNNDEKQWLNQHAPILLVISCLPLPAREEFLVHIARCVWKMAVGKNIRHDLHRLVLLCDELLLPDGGCPSGSPYNVGVYCNLLSLLWVNCQYYHQIFPNELLEILKQALSVLLTLSNQHGTLPLQSTPIIPKHIINKLVKNIGKPQLAVANLPHMGYYRVELGNFMAIIDGHEGRINGHSSFSALYLHHAGLPIFGACGFGDLPELYYSAAHSLSVIDNHHISPIHNGKKSHPLKPIFKRLKKSTSETFTLSHNAYHHDYGLVVERSISIMKQPNGVFGVEKFTGTGSRPIAIYFHCHPSVKITPTPKKNQFLLMLPDGQGLYFNLNNAEISLQRTIYGDKLGVHPAPLLLAQCESVAGETIIDWSLRLA